MIDFLSPIASDSVCEDPATKDLNDKVSEATTDAPPPTDLLEPLTTASSGLEGIDASTGVDQRKFVEEIRERLFASASAPCAIKRFHYEKDTESPVGQLVEHFK